MKKVIGMIIVVMMVVMVSCAVADDYEEMTERLNKLDNFLMENGLDEIYCRKVDEFGVYKFSGVVDRKTIDDYGFTGWDNLSDTFAPFYKKALNEVYPEYEVTDVQVMLVGTYENTDIYNIIVTGNGDLIDYIDGVQHIVDIMMVF